MLVPRAAFPFLFLNKQTVELLPPIALPGTLGTGVPLAYCSHIFIGPVSTRNSLPSVLRCPCMQSHAVTLSLSPSSILFHSRLDPQWASLLEVGPTAVLEETLPRDIFHGPPQGWKATV